MQSPHLATAIAHPNIALVKYWGKRPNSANVPAAGSLSLTLDTLFTRTQVRFVEHQQADTVVFEGAAASPRMAQRVSQFLDLVRSAAKCPWRAQVQTDNNFPAGAGLASSASAFAALALAATEALGVTLPRRALSALARQGSGSAARSVFGGFVQMHAGVRDDGSDAVAEPLAEAQHWPLHVVIAITSAAEKSVGSSAGMQRTRDTAPYYAAWIDSVQADLHEARAAVQSRDFAGLAAVAEHSCLKMHAVAMSARPPLLYWNPGTLAAMQTVQQLRHDGIPVFFTVDAGPQVKAICEPHSAAQVAEALTSVPGVQAVRTAALGPGAYLERQNT